MGSLSDFALKSGLALISTATASNVAAVDFTSGIDGSYDEFILSIQNAVPTTDNSNLLLRTSSDAGSTFDSGASDYAYTSTVLISPSTASNGGSSGAGEVLISGNVGSAANENGVSGEVKIFRPAAAEYTQVLYNTLNLDFSTNIRVYQGGGVRQQAASVNGIRLFFSAGNIESGEFKLYGVKKS